MAAFKEGDTIVFRDGVRIGQHGTVVMADYSGPLPRIRVKSKKDGTLLFIEAKKIRHATETEIGDGTMGS